MSKAENLRYFRRSGAPLPNDLLNGVTICVLIGPLSARKTYSIHKNLICAYSQYFYASFNGKFLEAGKKEVVLDEEDISVFDRVYVWLYSGTLHSEAERRDSRLQSHLTDLWLFGDRRSMPALQHAALDALNANVCETFQIRDGKFISVLYADSPPAAKVRLWMVEMFARMDDEQRIRTAIDLAQEIRKSAPDKDFLIALCKRLIELKREGEKSDNYKKHFEQLSLCQYHEHADQQDCDTLAKQEHGAK